jgi:hypothetical protein
MIIGAHAIVMSTDPAADRAFFKDVLKLEHVDEGGGWLIFGLPPSELAVHPGKKDSVHELYLMCEDVFAFVAAMKKRKLACAPVQDQGWGVLTSVTLPGGGKLGVYEPRHARPNATSAKKQAPSAGRASPKKATKAATKTAPKKPAKKAPARKR